jgi:uncharacterized Tic20 family protein
VAFPREKRKQVKEKEYSNMISNNSSMSSQDERIMAALSHISVLLPLIGVLAPILIWVTQKEKSRFVAFQSLQALAYQLSMIIAYALGMACYICSFFGNIGTILFGTSTGYGNNIQSFAEGMFFIPFLVMCMIILGGSVYVIYGVIGAIMSFRGNIFRYIIIGKRVERYMQRKQDVVLKE